ncbi:putative W2 domain, MIF4G-like domain superfamily protein [Helianthus annuus]|nr:putative W2 domain, MIF4G-like domain superfamily protein [Helianthus annuus]
MLSTEEPEKKVVKKSSPPVEENSNGSTKKSLVDVAKESLKTGVGPKALLASLSGSPQENASALYEALLDGVEKGFSKHLPIEDFCGKSNPNAVKEVALVLKALYDVDILEEEYVVKWYEEGTSGGNKSSPIWKNAKPFVEWLQSAESESEEE